MSGNWKHTEEKPVEGASCFPRILREASNRSELRKMIDQLLPDEVLIVSTYVEGLIKTRPIKMSSKEGWETTVDGAYWIKKEDRSHMAVLELENDPR